jgi:hypothetical protein
MTDHLLILGAGYLPAEHIETPTERLARLNKHRNIDLSATMLGDTAEKTKNPLKKAMRRRNAKNVQFAPPTYVEASDYDYSSDEGDGELFGGPEPKQIQQQQNAATDELADDDNLQVQPLKVNGAKKDANGQVDGDGRSSSDSTKREERGSDDADRPLDPKVTRNGTVRNTDSFFKDENTETRKITLTPNLLRDDSASSNTTSKERGPSLESLEKNGFADKVKDDKKKKEKKPGMLSGLFKRKDKKGKGDSVDIDNEKSEEVDRSSPQSKASSESAERQSAEQVVAPAPLRQSSKAKMQKNQRTRDDSPQKTKGILKTESPTETTMDVDAELDATEIKPAGQQSTPTMRLVSPELGDMGRAPLEERAPSAGSTSNTATSRNPISGMTSQQDDEVKPEKVKKSQERVQLDDFDSDEDSDPFADPDAQNKLVETETSEPAGRLSESPVHVSAADARPSQKENVTDADKEADTQQLPGLTTDNSSQETSSPVSTPTPDDNLMKSIPENTTVSTFRSESNSSLTYLTPDTATTASTLRSASNPPKERQPTPPTSSESTMLPAWSDASLRAYLDDGSDIRDMLVVINDTTGVVPVSRNHPLMKDYLAEETKTMEGLSGELDRLLNGLVEKRMKRAGSTASKTSTNRSTSATGRMSASGRLSAGGRS